MAEISIIFVHKCRVNEKYLQKEGKMKKIFKKITALAAALMIVPVMTVSAAPPVANALTTYSDIYEEIRNMFPDLTGDEAGLIAELTYIHSDFEMSYGVSAVSFDNMLEAYGIPLNDSNSPMIAAYGVIFVGASRDWCIDRGVDPAKMDAAIAKLGGSASASAPTWKQDGIGWWIENPDGSYLTNQWYLSPGSGLWYYMGADGYMLTNTTTPDGYSVDADGVWVQ